MTINLDEYKDLIKSRLNGKYPLMLLPLRLEYRYVRLGKEETYTVHTAGQVATSINTQDHERDQESISGSVHLLQSQCSIGRPAPDPASGITGCPSERGHGRSCLESRCH